MLGPPELVKVNSIQPTKYCLIEWSHILSQSEKKTKVTLIHKWTSFRIKVNKLRENTCVIISKCLTLIFKETCPWSNKLSVILLSVSYIWNY